VRARNYAGAESLHVAAAAGEAAAAALLLASGADAAAVDEHGRTALHRAWPGPISPLSSLQYHTSRATCTASLHLTVSPFS